VRIYVIVEIFLEQQILAGGMIVQNGIFDELILRLENEFEAMDSELSINLLENDEKYVALQSQIKEIDKKHRFIESVLDGEGELSLTAVEHSQLVEYIRLNDEAETRERKNLYYAGHRDCLAYLSQIGIL
jgi:nitrogen fixation/metabolism regulation signal transduction histidine kinase